MSQPEPASDCVFEVSIIIVSFNTRDMLRDCILSAKEASAGFRTEIFVVDNASRDGSADMVAAEFPDVKLYRSDVNLGFGVANNVALEQATGEFFVLLNSDAFFQPGALEKAVAHMRATPKCGLGGALLIGREGHHQPSAREFHTITGDALVLTGLSAKYPKSKFFGSFDRTWADPMVGAEVDWVPGAFSIIRPEALKQVGIFDPNFFLYYEEVDLCRRIKAAGWSIWYWPDVVVIHIGGESSRTLKSLEFASIAAQVVRWRMRSTLLYYRKHHGWKAKLAEWLELGLYSATVLRNRWSKDPERRARAERYRTLKRLMRQAWEDTQGGRVSPPAPW